MWDLDRRAAGCRRLVLQVGAMARPGPAGWREGAGRPRVLQVGDAAGGDTRALQVPTHGSRRSWKLGFVVDTIMLSTFVSDLFVRTCKNNHLITWLVDLLPISSEMQIRKTWLIFLIRGLRTITWTWLIVFFWFHQRCESGIAQSFCRLTLLLFPCPFRGQQLGQENWHQGGHIRLGIFAPSNLDFSEGGFVASIWLVDLGCIRCNLVEDSLARGLAGTRGHWHPSSHPRVKPIFAYNPGRRGISTSRTGSIIAVSFRFYAFLEAFQLWLPGFPLVVIMFNCWLARATLRFDCGSQERSQFCCLNLLACRSVLIVDEPRQTWYLSETLKGWLFVLVVDRVFFISIFLIFSWNIVNLLVNHQNLEKVCKYLCNIWESLQITYWVANSCFWSVWMVGVDWGSWPVPVPTQHR